MIFASGGYMFANIGQRHFFFGHSVDLGMFSRVPATSLQTVASMCAFPCTARRRAQVWAHPVGAGGQQRQIPHMRHSHPGLPRAHALFGGGASAVLFVRRTLTGDISFVVCAPICRSLPPSIPLSLSPLSLSLSLSLSLHPPLSGLARRVLFAADRPGVAAAAVPHVCTRSTHGLAGELGLSWRAGSFGSHARFPVRRALHLCSLLASHPGGGGPANGPHPLPLVLGRLGPASRPPGVVGFWGGETFGLSIAYIHGLILTPSCLLRIDVRVDDCISFRRSSVQARTWRYIWMWSASCRSTLFGVLRTGSCRDCDVGRARSVRHFRPAFHRVPWVLREILHGLFFFGGKRKPRFCKNLFY